MEVKKEGFQPAGRDLRAGGADSSIVMKKFWPVFTQIVRFKVVRGTGEQSSWAMATKGATARSTRRRDLLAMVEIGIPVARQLTHH
jgi:hypothetical protein